MSKYLTGALVTTMKEVIQQEVNNLATLINIVQPHFLRGIIHVHVCSSVFHSHVTMLTIGQVRMGCHSPNTRCRTSYQLREENRLGKEGIN